MKHVLFLTLVLLLSSIPTYGWKKQCFCRADPRMNEATTDCDTTIFENGSKLYWQYNCKRIWLTLENRKKRKRVINEVPVDLFGYTYRLGYHLIKEYKNSLLFRSGCPANGPCFYPLINKSNGNLIKEFDTLIEADTDVNQKDPHPYDFEFVVDHIYPDNRLVVYYINSGKVLNFPFDFEEHRITHPIPEQKIERMTLEGDLLTLYYETDDKAHELIELDLKTNKIGQGTGLSYRLRALMIDYRRRLNSYHLFQKAKSVTEDSASFFYSLLQTFIINPYQ